MNKSLNFSGNFDDRLLLLISGMNPQQLANWWLKGIDDMFFEGKTPGEAFSPGKGLLNDDNNITTVYSVIDILYAIFLKKLTQEEKNTISEESVKRLRNLNILFLHDNYPSLEKISGSYSIPGSIIGVTNGDELIKRYLNTLLLFTEEFKEAGKVRLSTLEQISKIHTAK